MLTTALNVALPATASAAPDWIELLPAGPEIIGADGRTWTLDLPHSVAASSRTPLVIDYEHASEHRAPQGLDAPAAGWVTRLEVRDGSAVWGHVEWTPKAAQQIQAREYRYLSPVFTYEKASRRIVALKSAGLTNQPNLPLTALNTAQPVALTPEERHAARLFGRTETETLANKQALLATDRNIRNATARLSPEERRVCEVMDVNPAEFLARKELL